MKLKSWTSRRPYQWTKPWLLAVLTLKRNLDSAFFLERDGSGDIHFGTISFFHKCFNFHKKRFSPQKVIRKSIGEKQLIVLLTYYTITTKSKSGFINERMVLLPGWNNGWWIEMIWALDFQTFTRNTLQFLSHNFERLFFTLVFLIFCILCHGWNPEIQL